MRPSEIRRRNCPPESGGQRDREADPARGGSTAETLILAREWFYEFPLPGGQTTRSYLPEFARPIHASRESMLFDYLVPWVQGRWSEMTCLDLACHEGYFAFKLALHGCRSVVGVDVRREHLDNAALIQRVYELENLKFVQGDIEKLDPALGVFDIVLVFGILYHVRDLIATLRNARAMTNGVCLIETQVAPELEGSLEWGSREWTREIRGCLALVDESEDRGKGTRESGMTSVSFVPSLKALLFLLGHAGFERVEILQPGPGAHEQHRRGKRVMVAAFAGKA
jgi:ubiquinone/menaquinone biosynthesis C-methylase UbiE